MAIKQNRDRYGRFLPNPFIQWYLDNKPDSKEKYKIGYFDIETSGLKAHNYIICWTIKERDKGYVTKTITKKEIFEYKFDKRLVEEFIKESRNYDLLVGYYSSCFDIPMLRSRAFHWKLKFIPYKTLLHIDLYFSVRHKVNTQNKSLDAICTLLGRPDKIHIPLETWTMAAIGEKRALDLVRKRNRVDCEILEFAHKYFESYCKFNKNWI